MTSDLGTDEWVSELAHRDPAPLAIIGGGTSDRARDLAEAMADRTTWHPERPLLLLTTATADQVYLERQNTDRPLDPDLSRPHLSLLLYQPPNG